MDDDSYFPISKSEKIFLDDGLKKLRRLSNDDRSKIANLKPFKGGHPHLFALHQADKTRKHQRLSLNSAHQTGGAFSNFIKFDNVGTMKIERSRFGEFYIEKLIYHGGSELGSNVGHEFLLITGLPLGFPVQLKFVIAYQDPPELKAKEVTATLTAWADTVSDIVRHFE